MNRCLSSKVFPAVRVGSRLGLTGAVSGSLRQTGGSRTYVLPQLRGCTKHRINKTLQINTSPKQIIQCGFQTSQNNRAVPPLLWMLFKPVAKLSSLLIGRASRKWFQDQPIWKQITYVSLVILSTFGFLSLIRHWFDAKQSTPVTNRRQFIILTPEQVLNISKFEAEMHLERYKECTLPATHPAYQPLLRVANRILKANQDLPKLMEMKWKLAVVDDPALNAFVLPTGHVFFTTTIMKFIENEDQLAIVFAHEMSHTLCSHAAESLSRSQYLDYCIIFFMAAIWTMIPSDGIALITQWFMEKVMQYFITLPFSRDMEEEADVVGMELAAKACYDVREGSVFWRRMMMRRDLTETVSKGAEFTSTHPSNESRIAIMEKFIPKAISIRDQCQCPALPEIDPRVSIKALRKEVDNVIIARKAGQDLRKVTKLTSVRHIAEE